MLVVTISVSFARKSSISFAVVYSCSMFSPVRFIPYPPPETKLTSLSNPPFETRTVASGICAETTSCICKIISCTLRFRFEEGTNITCA